MSNYAINLYHCKNLKEPFKNRVKIEEDLRETEVNGDIKIGHIHINKYYEDSLFNLYGKRLIDIFGNFVPTKDSDTSGALLQIKPKLYTIKKELHKVKAMFYQFNKEGLKYIDTTKYSKNIITTTKAIEIYNYYNKEDKDIFKLKPRGDNNSPIFYTVYSRKTIDPAIFFQDSKVVSIIDNVVILKCKRPYQWEFNYTKAILETIDFVLRQPNEFRYLYYFAFEKDK